ncbi:uncharacterized protein Z518_06039 [Rhinocladiella mackenziei CBS 650.93]|uniref:Probable E3 ubiquitin ligase complex SCF subunit sconB n=1 Tax=Rhinocladiella mackenziei CBS 650.93 TaxID=1442369 RepID=A0A0D2FSR5_9EURO|nr:uncharacterized protein Z518_06039 [Rhinocladiella mackenziei CBS 650.93]KIX05167.1 hypothetical protein Z518_06039 [Rhinocladiella mackenziei CBS 650.93]
MAARFQEWVMAQNEDARAEIAYEVLRTLRTSHIAAVVERLTPLLHMDPLEKLPPEITSQIFSYLDANTLLTASLASRTWRGRIMDTMLWQELYKNQGWGLDNKEIKLFESVHNSFVRHEFKKARGQLSGQPRPKKRATSDWLESRGQKVSADVSQWREQHGVVEADTDMQSETDDQEMQDAPTSIHNSPQRPNKRQSQDSGDETDFYPSSAEAGEDEDAIKTVQPLDPPFKPKLIAYDANGREKLNWISLYKQRYKLEQNWTTGRFTTFQLPHPAYPNEAHTECVYTIQFYGKWLVSGSRDKTLRIWDLETRRLRGKPLVGHSQSVLCLQFDPSEKEDLIISGSSDASVIIWRFSTGQKIHEIPSAHEESVLNLRFDHRYLVTCSKDRRIKIWNRRHLTATDPDYPKIKRDSPARVPLYIVNTSEMEPSLLEARMANGSIRALKPYTLLLTLEGHGAAVNAIQINGDLIVSASGDRLIKVWSARDGRLLRTLQGHQKGIACVQFDSRRIVSGSSDNTVKIYDPYTSAEVAELKGHTNLVRTVQAGFGDVPGADEDDSCKARDAERKYFDDLNNGIILENRTRSRRIRNGENGTSRLALGSKLPPGGGGSKWGRIVSGSYDESIIIWRKNSQGDWVVGQTLRQAPVVQQTTRQRSNPQVTVPNLTPPVLNPVAAGPVPVSEIPSTSNNAGPAGAANPAAMSASQIVQQAMGTSMVSLGAGISNVVGLGRVLNGPLTASRNGANHPQSFSSSSVVNGNAQTGVPSAMAHPQTAVSQAVQQALVQAGQQRPQPNHQNGLQNPTPQQPSHMADGSNTSVNGHAQPQQQQNPLPHHPHHPHPGAQQSHQAGPAQAQAQAHGQGQQPQPQQSSVSRVFKLQFDARRIVCCSQDRRIVGWDFANGDPEIIEASRFFVGP